MLVQNSSQEVQEYLGQREKAKKSYKKLEIKDFGVSGVYGGSGPIFSLQGRSQVRDGQVPR